MDKALKDAKRELPNTDFVAHVDSALAVVKSEEIEKWPDAFSEAHIRCRAILETFTIVAPRLHQLGKLAPVDEEALNNLVELYRVEGQAWEIVASNAAGWISNAIAESEAGTHQKSVLKARLGEAKKAEACLMRTHLSASDGEEGGRWRMPGIHGLASDADSYRAKAQSGLAEIKTTAQEMTIYCAHMQLKHLAEAPAKVWGACRQIKIPSSSGEDVDKVGKALNELARRVGANARENDAEDSANPEGSDA